MTVLSVFDFMIIKPIMLIMEVIFNLIKNIGLPSYLSIPLFSLVINVIILPLYLRTDIIQAEINEKEKLLKDKIEYIKRNFTGEERILILNTFYKQNGYSQFSIIKCIFPLILQVLIFICAFRFLSYEAQIEGLDLFNTLYVNMDYPDSMNFINSIRINVLPIIMFIISIFSCFFYCKKFSFIKSLPYYIATVLFFLLLYNSPSGVVLYWIFNNIFSLIKNIILNNKYRNKKVKKEGNSNNFTYKNSYVVILLLTNIVFFSFFVPLRYIITSPSSFIANYSNINIAILFLKYFCFCFGVFGIYGTIIYLLEDGKGKGIYIKILFLFTCIVIINFFIFTSYGYIFTSDLYIQRYGKPIPIVMILNYLLIGIAIFLIINNKFNKILINICTIILIAILIYSLISVVKICNYIKEANRYDNSFFVVNNNDDNKFFKLSTKGKNVIVIMLDHGLGQNVRYIFEENPELKRIYSGFTYYPNIISHASFTDLGLPAVFGGYEYTPIEMNKRNSELIIDKRGEAYSVLPSIFQNAGYNISILDEDRNDYHYILKNGLKTSDIYVNSGKQIDDMFLKRFFMFSIAISSVRFFQPIIYDNGNYLCSNSEQRIYSQYNAEGKPSHYIHELNKLDSLKSGCEIIDGYENNYMSIINFITHSPLPVLQAPEYSVKEYVDNNEYFNMNNNIFSFDSKNIFDYVSDPYMFVLSHYSLSGALLSLSKFINYLKDYDVYDNTRIIIVSDHGRHYKDLYEYNFSIPSFEFTPLLLVKDFNSTEFTENDEFMTNADVPTIALKDLIDDPINPFTGKSINDSEKKLHEQIIFVEEDYESSNKKLIKPSRWYSVHDNIYDINNWEYTDGKYVLDKYELPIDDIHKIENGGINNNRRKNN